MGEPLWFALGVARGVSERAKYWKASRFKKGLYWVTLSDVSRFSAGATASVSQARLNGDSSIEVRGVVW